MLHDFLRGLLAFSRRCWLAFARKVYNKRLGRPFAVCFGGTHQQALPCSNGGIVFPPTQFTEIRHFINMKIQLTQLPDTLKGPSDPDYRNQVPRRARFLEPTTATALLKLLADCDNALVFTDVYRSPEASLAAMRVKRGVQPPGFSAHNFGVAFDLDVGASLRALKTSYTGLEEMLNKHGWYSHRRDLDPVASESWHHNFYPGDPKKYLNLADLDNHSSWALPVEARIQELYGKDFDFDDVTLQTYLQSLKLYSGELDGKIGPLAQEATRVFQRAWNLAPDGAAGPRTKRTLAVVAATIQVVS